MDRVEGSFLEIFGMSRRCLAREVVKFLLKFPRELYTGSSAAIFMLFLNFQSAVCLEISKYKLSIDEVDFLVFCKILE